MDNRRRNKYPNNRYTKTNVQRSKKITPHQRKEVTEKANRNGFVLETIPANNYQDNSTYQERKESRNFFKDMYDKNGYYSYLWTPFIVLIVTIFFDFILQAIAFSLDSTMMLIIKESLFFLVFSVLVFCINVASIIFMGLSTSKHNVPFNVAWYRIFRIIAIIFLLESALTIIAFFVFPSQYIQITLFTQSMKLTYLIYLIAWNMIKAVVYMIMMSLAYLLFYKLKFV
ncbi:MAG TPA: hypothetical protein PLK55_02830 [archaeon]|jgi:hypothetical protein|nr:hypothetical protein [archaeon]